METRLKLGLYVLFFGLLTFIAAIFLPVRRDTYFREEILGATEGIEVFSEPENGTAPIVSRLNKASEQVLVEVYLLSDQQIIDELIRTDQRGVVVKVILEGSPFGGSGLNPTAKEKLENGGVEVKWSLKTFRFTHQKSIVFDHSEACILTLNLTTSAFTNNREFGACTVNSGEVDEVERIFWADWDNRGVELVENNLVVSPVNSRAKLASLVKQAEKSVDLIAEVLEDEKIIDELANKAAEIPVRVVLPPSSKLLANKDGAERLVRRGAIVKMISSPYVHAKMLIVDRKRAYVGSVNFSENSMDNNRELGIIVAQPSALGVLIGIFENDFLRATDYQ